MSKFTTLVDVIAYKTLKRNESNDYSSVGFINLTRSVVTCITPAGVAPNAVDAVSKAVTLVDSIRTLIHVLTYCKVLYEA